jgi:hypothetical protein
MPFSLGYWATAGAGGGGGGAGAYEQIATSFGTGSSGVITFSSIPSTYKHLQIRYTAMNTSTTRGIFLRMNSDTGSNYSYHNLYGEGSSVTSGAGTSSSSVILLDAVAASQTNQTSAGIIDILDYTSTTNNKTVRALYGQRTTNSYIYLASGNWRNTSAISNITLTAPANNFDVISRFSLYGIVG